MKRPGAIAAVLLSGAGWAQPALPPPSAPKLIALARAKPESAELRDAITAAFQGADLEKGTACAGEGPDFVFALTTEATPAIVIDDDVPVTMARVGDSGVWYRIATLTTGRTHNFHYVIGGQNFGGKENVPAYGPDSYEHAGIPKGTLTPKMVHTSAVYPGMKSDYWVYAPAQYDAKASAAVMIWQDGEAQVERDGASRTLNIVDNLTARKAIPVMIHIFISPGLVGDKKMRSIEYDTVSDRYPRFLLEEILPEVSKHYNLRKDAYSRGIAGESSGGICAFNAAWYEPEQFSRVISRVGSFASIQWKNGEADGGNDYPFKVRKEAKRNIRVWLQDGENDLENQFGSWPLQNIQMANSLKLMGYDFHLSFGNNSHTRTAGFAEAAEELTWLWRDYDPAKTSQPFEMEPAEKAAPMFRVRISNRN